jgi:tetratricopeptide (TPR) repeat protein
MSAARHDQAYDPMDEEKVMHLLQVKRFTATSSWALDNVSACILDECKALQPAMEKWLKTMINKSRSRFSDPSYNYFLLGRTLLGQGKINEAVDAYRKSYELDPQYLNPMIELADTYIQLGRLDYAQIIISEIKRANQHVNHPKEKELSRLQALMHDRRSLAPLTKQ